jgi:methylmalonyl-CoA mutase N-terminal domain/subunit
MERGCYDYFRKIDELGGMVDAVKRGFPQREIAEASFELQMDIDAGRRVVVGVNRFPEGDNAGTPILRIDPESERRQVSSLAAVKAARDGEVVAARLADIQEAAIEGRNLMPELIEAARASVSEGEIVQALQGVWGGYRETPVF